MRKTKALQEMSNKAVNYKWVPRFAIKLGIIASCNVEVLVLKLHDLELNRGTQFFCRLLGWITVVRKDQVQLNSYS